MPELENSWTLVWFAHVCPRSPSVEPRLIWPTGDAIIAARLADLGQIVAVVQRRRRSAPVMMARCTFCLRPVGPREVTRWRLLAKAVGLAYRGGGDLK
jgi:hypothetical protein